MADVGALCGCSDGDVGVPMGHRVDAELGRHASLLDYLLPISNFGVLFPLDIEFLVLLLLLLLLVLQNQLGFRVEEVLKSDV